MLTVDHSTIQRWVFKFSILIENQVRRLKKQVDSSWRMDETYVKVNGRWVYLYRTIDKFKNTVDFLLRDKRDANAAKAFFKPQKVVVDKSGSNKLWTPLIKA